MTGINKKIDNWWRSTFGKEYFTAFDDLCTAKRTKTELKFITKNLNLPAGAKILDIPCGQGRHSIALTQYGFKVTGIDYSSAPLKVAIKRAKTVNNKVSPTFVKRDMRFIKIKERFDAVITLGNSFGYFNDNDNKQVIKNISTVLKKGGYFLLDLANAAGMLRHIKGKKKLKIPQGYIETESVSFDAVSFILQIRWTIVRNHNKKIFMGKLRLYIFPEIHSMLRRHGLSIIKTFGSFDGKKYSLEAPRLIIIARKK